MNQSTDIFPLKLDNVQVRKRGKVILNDITLTLEQEGITIVMGPNGSGKTTLMRLMHGLERPKSGKLQWATTNEIARSKQSFVFQTPIMMRRRVRENLLYPLKLRSKATDELNKLVEHWLLEAGLEDKTNIAAHFLSGGERQKLAIARAMITEPSVLFLDEPTTNLDGQSTREIETLLKKVQSTGTCIVLSTHDIGQAKRLADKVIFLNHGRLCEFSTADSFFASPDSKVAQAYLDGEIVE